MTYAMAHASAPASASPLHRAKGFHINVDASRVDPGIRSGDLSSAFSLSSAGFINPLMTMHSPHGVRSPELAKSPTQNLFDLGSSAHALNELDILNQSFASLAGDPRQAGGHAGPSSGGGEAGGNGQQFGPGDPSMAPHDSSYMFSPPLAQPQAIPRYFTPGGSGGGHSAAPSDIFAGGTPDTLAGSYTSTIAVDLAAGVHSPLGPSSSSYADHRRSLSASSSSAAGKAPRPSVSARSARRFTVSGSASPTIKAEVQTPAVRWFEPATPVDIAVTPHRARHDSSISGYGSAPQNPWIHSPPPVSAIDVVNGQMGRNGGNGGQQGQGFMPSSAPATSTSFALGRVPPSRLRSDSQITTMTALSDVGEEDGGRPQTYTEHQTGDKRRKRRESHNAVERRRRDHINQAISDLSHLIPTMLLEPTPGASTLTHHHVHNAQMSSSPTFTLDEFGSPTPGGALLKPNKGLILERSVDYIRLLQQQVATLNQTCSSLKDTVHRLGGDPSIATQSKGGSEGLSDSTSSSSTEGHVGLRSSSNGGGITIGGGEADSSASSVDGYDLDHAMQP